jgi:hypothetical protein
MTSPAPPTATAPPLPERSLLRDDPLMRLQRRIGLAPENGLGVGRRAVFWALIAWLPIAIWAVVSGRAVEPPDESLLAHYGVSVRLLLALPLMIVAEGLLLGTIVRIAPHCADSGLFHGDRNALRATAIGLAELRDRVHPWAVAVGVALAWMAAWGDGTVVRGSSDAFAWAGSDGPSGFGPLWYLWVARPIFLAAVVVWVWRALLLGIALHRLTTAGLGIVPTHPDRAGGYGFLEALPGGFGLVAFALSATIASSWAHQVLHHDLDVMTLRVPMVAAVVLITLLFVAPLAVLVGPMGRARRDARLAYGALVARHADALQRKWIGGETVDDPLLDAPEIGAAADAATLYDAVGRMRPMPIGRASLAAVAVPAAIPMIAVFATQVPIGPLLKGLVAALV